MTEPTTACLWTQEKVGLSGRLVERCWRHRHVRVPRLTLEEARANEALRRIEHFKRVNALFKATYGSLLASAWPPPGVEA